MGWLNNRSVQVGLAYMRPIADNVDGNWTNESGSNVDLFASVDEVSPASDADFIKSGLTPSADKVKLKLTTPIAPVGPVVVFYRYWKSGAPTMNLTVNLKQGNTVISTVTLSDISRTPTDGNFQLSSPEFASITDFGDLYIEFQAN